LRHTDRQADLATADDRQMAVAGHLRHSVSCWWPLCLWRPHVGQFVVILVSKSAGALCRRDSALFCESVSKQRTNPYLGGSHTVYMLSLVQPSAKFSQHVTYGYYARNARDGMEL